VRRPDLAARNTANRIDICGQRFGRLIARTPDGQDKWGALLWRCSCDCGNETRAKTSALRRGAVTSCGCAQRERRLTWNLSHGEANSRLYRIWQGMITRTTSPNSRGWRYYGSRGICVCDEWFDFAAFLEWALSNGYAPKLSIDRINNDGNYEPNNCRWVTQQAQVRNRRTKSEMEKVNMSKSFRVAAAQGEVNVLKINAMPKGLTLVGVKNGVFIIGHSESGNTHVINAAGVTVMERTKDVPAGMRMLYAIIERPTELRQNASTPHETISLDPGIFLFRISREFDPFAEQARRVAD